MEGDDTSIAEIFFQYYIFQIKNTQTRQKTKLTNRLKDSESAWRSIKYETGRNSYDCPSRPIQLLHAEYNYSLRTTTYGILNILTVTINKKYLKLEK